MDKTLQLEKSFGPLYTPFDETGINRETYHSRQLTKLEVVNLYQKLYSEYLKVFLELKNIKKKIEEEHNVSIEVAEAAAEVDKNAAHSLFNSPAFRDALEEFIDNQITSKLSLDEDNVEYGNTWVSLNYGDRELGDSICLR